MSKRITKFSSGKVNTLKIARSWLQLGILPVPLEPKSKRPISKKGWNALRVTEETIPDFFQEGQNVGGLWGEPSGWLVDIDLDCPEAIAVAPHILPETFVYGRKSSPGSHYVYRCQGIATTKFSEKDEGMIAEIRSTGSQSVLPPSIHPENERYQIDHDVPFKTISRKELETAVKGVTAAAMLVRYYPTDGGRHDYVHTITGTLLWNGWAEAKVRQYLNAILDAASAKESDTQQRERTVTNTIEHFRQGDRVAGWKTLSQWLPGALMGLLRKWLSMETSDQVPETIDRSPEYEFDTSLLNVPGLVGDLAKWSSETAYLQQPIFNLAVGLMCTALATTNKYAVEGWDTPLQPYFMLTAPSSAGKEIALENVYKFARRINLHEHAIRGFQSYHSMLDRLAAPPNMACWLWDEAARMLKGTRGAGSPEQAVMTWLLSLYGKGNSFSPGIPGRHHAIPPIDHPFLTVLGAAQPEQLMEAITTTDLSTGLVNRFVLFDAGNEKPPSNLDRRKIFPAKLEETINRMRAIEPPSGEYPFIPVRFSETRVWAMFRDFDEEARSHAYNGGGGEMWGRSNQNALILAGLVAVGIEPRTPRITIPIAEWAIRFIRWSSTRWTQRVDESSSRSVVESRSKTVERTIRRARNFIEKTEDPNQKKLMARGLLPRSMLSRTCRHISGRDLEDAINTLIVAGTICTGEQDGVDVLWCKA